MIGALELRLAAWHVVAEAREMTTERSGEGGVSSTQERQTAPASMHPALPAHEPSLWRARSTRCIKPSSRHWRRAQVVHLVGTLGARRPKLIPRRGQRRVFEKTRWLRACRLYAGGDPRQSLGAGRVAHNRGKVCEIQTTRGGLVGGLSGSQTRKAKGKAGTGRASEQARSGGPSRLDGLQLDGGFERYAGHGQSKCSAELPVAAVGPMFVVCSSERGHSGRPTRLGPRRPPRYQPTGILLATYAAATSASTTLPRCSPWKKRRLLRPDREQRRDRPMGEFAAPDRQEEARRQQLLSTDTIHTFFRQGHSRFRLWSTGDFRRAEVPMRCRARPGLSVPRRSSRRHTLS
ncbi:uncharacterized protein PSFLO_02786 [Pseudozyma flocculosa]|uniref:Uncharacterized protein n=1 Tax=Pseudozyma flocculosa TaxID=84751 RepID=A0A5C3EYG8_9BASI|nr:uncharacterized protein PSFLO_02786 [Pseudozyma flocculosa]